MSGFKKWMISGVLAAAAMHSSWAADPTFADEPDAAASAPGPAKPVNPRPASAVNPVSVVSTGALVAGPAIAASAASPSDLNTPDDAAAAQPPAAAASGVSLDERIQDVKGDVMRINRDLMVLEEELLFPANTQVAVFVSMDVGKLFELGSVQVKLDDKVVANYLYTPHEVKALHRGGVQRVYVGNLKAGEHELVAFFTGGGPHFRDYRRGAELKFEKGTEPKYIELKIRDTTATLQPEFDVKVWQ